MHSILALVVVERGCLPPLRDQLFRRFFPGRLGLFISFRGPWAKFSKGPAAILSLGSGRLGAKSMDVEGIGEKTDE